MKRAVVALAIALPGCESREAREKNEEHGAAQAEVSTLDAPLEKPKPGDRTRALALLDDARHRLAAGQRKDALALLEQAIAADPACVPARLELGFFLFEDFEFCNYGGALEQFRVARLLAPDERLAIAGEGLTRHEIGDVDRAEPLIRAAVASGAVKEPPSRVATLIAALARINAIRGNVDDALRGYEQAANVPDVPPLGRSIQRARRADLLAQSGRDAEAEAELRIALALDPENLRAHHLRSRLLAKRGATAEAAREARIHELLRALTDHRSKLALQDTDRRVALRRELVRTWPEHSRAAYDVVEELLAGGRFDEARVEIGVLAKRDGLTPEIQGLLARAMAGTR